MYHFGDRCQVRRLLDTYVFILWEDVNRGVGGGLREGCTSVHLAGLIWALVICYLRDCNHTYEGVVSRRSVKFRDILRTILESGGAVLPAVAETLDRMHKVGRWATLRGTTTASTKVKP